MKKSLRERERRRSACTGARNLTTWKNQASMFLSFHDNGAAVATKEKKREKKNKKLLLLFPPPPEKSESAEEKSRKHAPRSCHERFSEEKDSPGVVLRASFEFSSRKNPGGEWRIFFLRFRVRRKDSPLVIPGTVGHCLSEGYPAKQMRRLSCRVAESRESHERKRIFCPEEGT